MRNQDIHELFNKSGVKKWLAAEELGIADTTFSKRLRRELSQTEREEIISIIEKLKNKESNSGC
jgi:hypothetical protein